MELIWDFDGTLFDTYPLMAQSLRQALLDAFTMRERLGPDFRGRKVTILGDILFSRVARSNIYLLNKVSQRALERYKENLHKAGPLGVQPFPGARELCERIVAEGGHNHLCTHRGSSARWYMDAQGLSDCFTTWVTEENGFPRKPAPDGVNYILSRSKSNKRHFVMVGDRELDILAAHRAGIRACRFTGGEPIESVPTEAEYKIQYLKDFFNVVKEEEK